MNPSRAPQRLHSNCHGKDDGWLHHFTPSPLKTLDTTRYQPTMQHRPRTEGLHGPACVQLQPSSGRLPRYASPVGRWSPLQLGVTLQGRVQIALHCNATAFVRSFSLCGSPSWTLVSQPNERTVSRRGLPAVAPISHDLLIALSGVFVSGRANDRPTICLVWKDHRIVDASPSLRIARNAGETTRRRCFSACSHTLSCETILQASDHLQLWLVEVQAWLSHPV
jgi:hypothetical protein